MEIVFSGEKIDAKTLKVGDIINLGFASYEACLTDRNACLGCAFDSVETFYIDCSHFLVDCCKTEEYIIFKEIER